MADAKSGAVVFQELIETFECRYRLNDGGVALPIEPLSIDSARAGAGA